MKKRFKEMADGRFFRLPSGPFLWMRLDAEAGQPNAVILGALDERESGSRGAVLLLGPEQEVWPVAANVVVHGQQEEEDPPRIFNRALTAAEKEVAAAYLASPLGRQPITQQVT